MSETESFKESQITYPFNSRRLHTNITTCNAVEWAFLRFGDTLGSKSLPCPRSSMEKNEKSLAFVGDDVGSYAQMMPMGSDGGLNELFGLSRYNETLECIFVPRYVGDMVDSDKP